MNQMNRSRRRVTSSRSNKNGRVGWLTLAVAFIWYAAILLAMVLGYVFVIAATTLLLFALWTWALGT